MNRYRDMYHLSRRFIWNYNTIYVVHFYQHFGELCIEGDINHDAEGSFDCSNDRVSTYQNIKLS